MGIIVTSGTLGGVLVSTLAWSAIYVGSIPALGAMFPIFITPTTIVSDWLSASHSNIGLLIGF